MKGWISLFFLLLCSSLSYSQGLVGGGSDRIEGKMKFIPLPLVDYDNSYGFSVGVLPMLMFNVSEKDTISPSSVVGLLGLYSENKTWYTVAFAELYLKEDNWRVTLAGGLGENNFQYFADMPVNRFVPYNTQLNFVYAKALKKIKGDLYGGVNYVYGSSRTSSEFYTDATPVDFQGLGLSSAFDKRSNVTYPISGYQVNADFSAYPESLGNKHSSSQIDIDVAHYFSNRQKKDVIATRFYAGFGLGKPNFDQQYIVGDLDIRGYTKGQFRGNHILTLQSEYRWNFFKKLGAVGFAGIATIMKSVNPDHDDRLFPAAGVGFRYTYMDDTHSNVGFDIAKGIDDWGFYLRLSESF